jgi:hypothetical protein
MKKKDERKEVDEFINEISAHFQAMLDFADKDSEERGRAGRDLSTHKDIA